MLLNKLDGLIVMLDMIDIPIELEGKGPMPSPAEPVFNRRSLTKALALSMLVVPAALTTGCIDEKKQTARALVGSYELTRAGDASARALQAYGMRIIFEFKDDGTGMSTLYLYGDPAQEDEFTWKPTGKNEASMTINSKESVVELDSETITIGNDSGDSITMKRISQDNLEAKLAEDGE